MPSKPKKEYNLTAFLVIAKEKGKKIQRESEVKKGEFLKIKLKMKRGFESQKGPHPPHPPLFLSPNLFHYFPMKIINLLFPNLPPISSYLRWQLVNQLIHFRTN
jgi:hypothetical protein